MLRTTLALAFLTSLFAGLGCGTSTGGNTGGGGGTTSSGNGGTAGHAGGLPTVPTPACYPGENAPGAAIPDPAQAGTGPCAGKTLADVLTALHTAYPEWNDVTNYASEGPLTTGSFVYAFQRPDGGFAIVLQRGSGDCEEGCVNHVYGYFETDAACAPVKAGDYQAIYGVAGNCFDVEGAPRWSMPTPMDPALACGADDTPLSISGAYTVHVNGLSASCVPKDSATQGTVDGPLSLSIAQDPADLSKGTVTVTGTGNPLIDGRALQATFERRRFVVNEDVMSTDATCPQSHTLELRYDFEGGCGAVHLFEYGTGCIECKGSYDAALGPG